jgi:hypothetical protein
MTIETGVRRGLGRTPAALLVVLAAALALGGTACLVTAQCAGLLRELPAHRDYITAKVREPALAETRNQLSTLAARSGQ